jgi:hypothetical protein
MQNTEVRSKASCLSSASAFCILTTEIMSTEVVMPQMGESIAEGTITRWMKQVGERVERDEPLFEISTDKVDARYRRPPPEL